MIRSKEERLIIPALILPHRRISIFHLLPVKEALDERKVRGAILTDLSKAFDCLSQDLVIAKLAAYGFGKSALLFVYDYLKIGFSEKK